MFNRTLLVLALLELSFQGTVSISYATDPPSSSGFLTGLLTFTFDDGRDGQRFVAADMLMSEGFEATLFVYPSGLTGVSGYMSEDDVSELQNSYGWEVGSETSTHKDLTTCATSDCLQTEIVQSKSTLQGFDWNVTSFAYPFGKGSKNMTVTPLVRSTYRAARVVGYPSSPPPRYGDVNLDFYTINSNDVQNSTSLTTVTEWIDTAIQTKTWLVLRFHQISSSESAPTIATYPRSGFQAIVDYARSKVESHLLRVMRFNRVLDRIGLIRSGTNDFLDPIPPREQQQQPPSNNPPPASNSSRKNQTTTLPPSNSLSTVEIAGIVLVLAVLSILSAGMVSRYRRRGGKGPTLK